MKLLFGHDKTVADWASQKSGSPLRNWHHAIGIINSNGVLIGAASFHDMNGSNVELCFHGPNSVSLSIMRGLARFVFEQLGAARVTAKTPRANKMVCRHLPRFGWKFEGVMRRYYGRSKRMDAIVFGLLKEDATKLLGKGGAQ